MSRRLGILNCESAESEKILILLRENSDFFCIGIANGYESSLDLILKYQPEIIIINIDNFSKDPINTPFNLIKEIYQYLDFIPSLVAISSSTTKAYDSIKLGFRDYLLKPLTELDIRKCLIRLNKSLKKESTKKICLKSNSDYRYIDLKIILYLKADNNSTDFYLKNEVRISGFKSLKFYETLLPTNFLRIHNSFVINTDHISRINFGQSLVTLIGLKEKIPFSRAHKYEMELLKSTLDSLNAVPA